MPLRNLVENGLYVALVSPIVGTTCAGIGFNKDEITIIIPLWLIVFTFNCVI